MRARPPQRFHVLALLLSVWCAADPAASAQPAADDAVPSSRETDYGTDGFLGRLVEGTAEIDRCSSRDELEDKERTRRASDHYDRGLVLYEEGDYSAAIDEFVSSYCDKPHPSAFYNIGQSFERLLAYGKAVAYFERYIMESGDDAPNRKRAALRAEVLKALPAQIRVATVPPAANVTLRSDVGVTARGIANADKPMLVRKGRYSMTVRLPGYEILEQEVVAEIGQPYSFYLRLTPLKGNVRVTTAPGNARIFLDDRLVGIGSYVETVDVGTYAVTVEAEGREPQKHEVAVKPGQSTEMSIALAEPPESGRTALLVASTLGLSLGGASLTTALEEDSGTRNIAALAGLGVGFGGAYYGIPESIERGHAWYIISTTAIGAVEGGLMASYFSCRSSNDPACRERAVAGAGLSLGLVGAIAGALTARRVDYTTGDVAVLVSAGLWGATTGSLFHEAFDGDSRIREPMIFAGTNLGLASAITIISQTDVSLRRMALIDLAGVGGMVGGVALASLLDSELEQVDHLSILGLATGLVVGTFLTRSMDELGSGVGTVRPAVQPIVDTSGSTHTTIGAIVDF